jgi:hypothetical protein
LEMQKNAAEAILGGTEWLIAADIARLTKRSKSNPNALANRWKNEGKVFAIRYEGVERYPRYAFNDRLEPLPVIAEVLQLFGKDTDPWKLPPGSSQRMPGWILSGRGKCWMSRSG